MGGLVLTWEKRTSWRTVLSDGTVKGNRMPQDVRKVDKFSGRIRATA